MSLTTLLPPPLTPVPPGTPKEFTVQLHPERSLFEQQALFLQSLSFQLELHPFAKQMLTQVPKTQVQQDIHWRLRQQQRLSLLLIQCSEIAASLATPS